MPSRTESPDLSRPFTGGDIVDIGGGQVASLIYAQLQDCFVRAKAQGERPSLPEEPLYDDEGLRIWSKVIYHPQYYQTQDEIDLLVQNGKEIASYIQPGTKLIDLGAGDTRKVAHLLAIFDRLDIPATYLALDISRDSLARGVGDIACRYDHIQCVGLWGSFNDMHLYLRHLDDRPRLFLSLGSVLFNDATEKAVKSLRTWAKRLRDQDMILAGMDGHRAPEDYSKLMASYHGKGGEDLWNRFWKNGFKRLNMIVGSKLFRLEDWEVHGKIQNSPTEGVSHQFTFEARRNVAMDVLGIKFAKGEKFDWFDAHKNGEDQVRQMCDEVGLEVVKVWKKPGSRMTQYLIRRRGSKE